MFKKLKEAFIPYKCVGSNLMHQKGGKWSLKQHCKSPSNCKAAMALLHGLESGSIKRKDVGKKQ